MRSTKFIFACVLCFAAMVSVRAAETLTFVSVNAWSGLSYRGFFRAGTYETQEQRTFRYGLLINGLKDLDADVIAVQQANTLPGFARRMARDLGCHYVYAVAKAGVRLGPVGLPVNLREGMVILAKKHLNLRYVGTRRLSGGYAGNFAAAQLHGGTAAMAAAVTVGRRTVYLFVTEWTPSEYAREESLDRRIGQYAAGDLDGEALVSIVSDAVEGRRTRTAEAKKTAEFIEETVKDGPAVVMGSLHALPGSPEIGVLAEAGLVDCWDVNEGPGVTWDAESNSCIREFLLPESDPDFARRDRIDYVYCLGEGIRPAASRIVLAEPTYRVHPSAHYGVLVSIEFQDDVDSGDLRSDSAEHDAAAAGERPIAAVR